MWRETLIPYLDLAGMVGFLFAAAYGTSNYRTADIERPFWLAFTFTAGLGALWLGLVSLEWFGVSPLLLDEFSTSRQAVVIGLYAIGVIGTDVIVRELGNTRREIDKRASIVSVLSRLLRHNIRNDMTMIRGYLMADGGEEIVKEKIDELLSTSEKARKLEQTLKTDEPFRQVSLGAMLREIQDDMPRTYRCESIDLAIGDTVDLLVPISIRTALEELIENAVVHGGENPSVVVKVSTTPETIRFAVIDNGPGLPASEQQLLDELEETGLLHSDGIGLWLVQWIAANHESALEARVGPDGTTHVDQLTQRHDREAASSVRGGNWKRRIRSISGDFRAATRGMCARQ